MAGTPRKAAEKAEQQTDEMPDLQSYDEAMAWVQQRLPHVHKGNEVVAGPKRYSFADLADVHQAILPLTAKAGLVWTTAPKYDETGRYVLTYSLRHKVVGEVSGSWPLPDPATTPPQQVGSAITYARRYTLQCVTGIAPDADDDGQAAQAGAEARQRRDSQPRQEAPPTPEADTDGFTEAVLAALDAEDPRAALADVRSRVWSTWHVMPRTRLADPHTGEEINAERLLANAAASISNENVPGDADTQAALDVQTQDGNDVQAEQ